MPLQNQIKHCYNYAKQINCYSITMSYILYMQCFKETKKENTLVCKLATSLQCYNKYNKARMSCYILTLTIKQ